MSALARPPAHRAARRWRPGRTRAHTGHTRARNTLCALTALLVAGAQVAHKLKGLVNHPVGPRRGAIHLVHHDHHLSRGGPWVRGVGVWVGGRGAARGRPALLTSTLPPPTRPPTPTPMLKKCPDLQLQRLVQHPLHAPASRLPPQHTPALMPAPSCSAPAPCAAQSASAASAPPPSPPAAARRRPC